MDLTITIKPENIAAMVFAWDEFQDMYELVQREYLLQGAGECTCEQQFGELHCPQHGEEVSCHRCGSGKDVYGYCSVGGATMPEAGFECAECIFKAVNGDPGVEPLLTNASYLVRVGE